MGTDIVDPYEGYSRRAALYNPSGQGARLVYSSKINGRTVSYGYHDAGEVFTVFDVDIIGQPNVYLSLSGEPFSIVDGVVYDPAPSLPMESLESLVMDNDVPDPPELIIDEPKAAKVIVDDEEQEGGIVKVTVRSNAKVKKGGNA